MTSVAYAATVTPVVPASGSKLVLNIGTLTGNITIANPSTATSAPSDGQQIQLRLVQDGTGNRTISFGTQYAFSTEEDITTDLFDPSAGSKMWLLFEWDATDSLWVPIAMNRRSS